MNIEIIDLKNKTRTVKESNNIITDDNEEYNKQKLIKSKQLRLEELTKDFAQVNAGFVIDNLEERKTEFRKLLNEVRVLQGKEPRNQS